MYPSLLINVIEDSFIAKKTYKRKLKACSGTQCFLQKTSNTWINNKI